MTPKIFRNILIICLAAFMMAAISVALGANYLLTYKPSIGEKDINTFIVTDEKGNTQIVSKDPIEGSYNFLVLGHDRAALNTDVIMLVNYNINKKSVTITQFPRDCYVSNDVPAHKINSSFGAFYSEEINRGTSHDQARLTALQRFADTLEEALGINIYRSAIMDLNGFVKIVDLLGGVDVDVPANMYYVDESQGLYINLRAGMQTLNGDQAEQFVRFRSGYVQADIGRENAQKIFLSAFIQKAKETISLSNTGKLTDIAGELLDNVTTDITIADFVFFAKGLLSDVDLSNIKMITVPGTALQNEQGWSYYVIQRESLKEIIENYYISSEIESTLFDQIFDQKVYFTDLNSAIFSDSYYSKGVPQINDEYNAQEVAEGSIDIPRY